MNNADLIKIFSQGGFALVAIAILFYFLRRFCTIFENHISHLEGAIDRMAEEVSKLAESIKELKGMISSMRKGV